MGEKDQILNLLREEFGRWDLLLSDLSEERIAGMPLHPGSYLTIKDIIAHLWTWQQRSIARLEAALHGTQPDLSSWPETLDPESEDDLDLVNAWIYERSKDKPWAQVYQDWRSGFLRFIELAEAVPEADLLQPGKYPWLPDYPLLAVLQGSYEHHHEEHLGSLLEWVRS